jgi:hypothetical protein
MALIAEVAAQKGLRDGPVAIETQSYVLTHRGNFMVGVC